MMELEKCRIGMKVRLKEGDVATIDELYSNGAVRALDGIGVVVRRWASDLTPVSDPCHELEAVRLKAFWEGKASCYDQISGLISSRDYWQASCTSARRDAAYWREELTKLQKETLAEHEDFRPFHIRANRFITGNFYCDDERKPLSEVANIYVTARVDASQMLAGIRKAQQKLLSDDAKIVCELLEGSGPMTSLQIADRLNLRERCILENLVEAREAGIVQLVDGKYSIVRD